MPTCAVPRVVALQVNSVIILKRTVNDISMSSVTVSRLSWYLQIFHCIDKDYVFLCWII